MLWNPLRRGWEFRRFSGTAWQRIRQAEDQRFVLNSYRVLLTRAREGIIFWVPPGDSSDRSRAPEPLDYTADYLLQCGAVTSTNELTIDVAI
jgi:hypothetical protein